MKRAKATAQSPSAQTVAAPAARTIGTARSLLGPQVMVAMFIALKIYFDIVMPPIGDEAYYWMWGQKLALSYFDHPPFHAWMLRLVDIVFGWNLFSLRALTWFTLAGTFAIFWAWARRLAPDNAASYFWHAAAIYLASPVIMVMTSITFHDHLMIFLCFASAYFFLAFAEGLEQGRPRYRDLYFAAILLGLAVLTKYNAVFLGLGYAAMVLIRPSLRPMLRNPHVYAAGLASVAIQFPVLYWNITEGFASYKFHLVERWDSAPLQVSTYDITRFLISTVLVLSPFLVFPIAKYIARPAGGAFAQRAKLLAISVFVLSTAAMMAMAFFVEVHFYWNIVAFLLLLPFIVHAVGSRWVFWGHMFFGLVLSALVIVNYTTIPLALLFNGVDWGSSVNFGWDRISTEVAKARETYKPDFLAATRYTTAAQLGFALKDPDVTALSDRHDQYDYWFVPEDHRGEDAIILADFIHDIGPVEKYFERVTLLDTLDISGLGFTFHTFHIYLGEGFKPSP